MPEMPEVRTVSSDMNKLIKGKTIKKVLVFNEKIVKDNTPSEFIKFLEGEKILNISNIGKWIVTELTNEKIYLSHLRMTGRYNLHDKKHELGKHTHISFIFNDGAELTFEDPRRFATAHIRNKKDLWKTKPIITLGPEPDLKQVDYFFKKINKSRRPIKTLVLDQTIILGYGNIYVDESLWMSNIHPLTKGNQITKLEAKNILEIGKKIMDKSTKLGGSSISTYGSVNGKPGRYAEYIKVFRKNGKPCPNCKNIIKKIRVGGRGTHFCPNCQKQK
ncbi:MAG: bifunctional DNA-formamidopyrimidine glycosylase/DNA-(apurinic or apyrimidinic site) lyase [Mycoplasma sp.]|nr:bifunctional DNA-formamidopyrimidine glycosylase/DNA-(apurinic or apyrimidinic site) lyase [Mycoplasma sp.]